MRGPEFEVLVTPPKKVVSVKLDADLVDLVDKFWRMYGYRSRSEFIREAILFFIAHLGRRDEAGAHQARATKRLDPDELERALEEALGEDFTTPEGESGSSS